MSVREVMLRVAVQDNFLGIRRVVVAGTGLDLLVSCEYVILLVLNRIVISLCLFLVLRQMHRRTTYYSASVVRHLTHSNAACRLI